MSLALDDLIRLGRSLAADHVHGQTAGQGHEPVADGVQHILGDGLHVLGAVHRSPELIGFQLGPVGLRRLELQFSAALGLLVFHVLLGRRLAAPEGHIGLDVPGQRVGVLPVRDDDPVLRQIADLFGGNAEDHSQLRQAHRRFLCDFLGHGTLLYDRPFP